MKGSGKIAAVLLAVTLLLAGCAGGDVSWVFRSGGVDIPPGLYIIYEIQAFAEAEEKIAGEHANDPEYSQPKPSDLLKLTVEGQPASDWISAQAQQKTRKHIAARQKFEEMGLALTEYNLATIESNVGSTKSQSGDFYEKNGISDASLREYYTGVVRETAVFQALYGEGGEYAVPRDEQLKYFDETYAIIDAMPMYQPTAAPEGETKTIEELRQEVKAAAEEYLRRLTAGEEIETLMYEWELKNTDEAEKDKVEKPEKGDLRLVIAEASRASFGDELVDAALASKPGVPELVEGPAFFAVFNRIDPAADPETFDTYKSMLLYEMKNEEYSEKLASWAAAAEIEENAAALSKYKPGKLKLDSNTQ